MSGRLVWRGLSRSGYAASVNDMMTIVRNVLRVPGGCGGAPHRGEGGHRQAAVQVLMKTASIISNKAYIQSKYSLNKDIQPQTA